MGFWSKLLGREKGPPPVNEEVFIAAARLISGGDESLVAEMCEVVENHEAYLAEKLRGGVSYRGLSSDSTKYEICFAAMIELLMVNGYLKEFYWRKFCRREETDAILRGLSGIAERLHTEFRPQMDLSFLDEDEDLENLEQERVFTLVAVYVDYYKYALACFHNNCDHCMVCLLPHRAFDECKKMFADMTVLFEGAPVLFHAF